MNSTSQKIGHTYSFKRLFKFVLFALMKLVERMPRVCKAAIKAKGGDFEESKI